MSKVRLTSKAHFFKELDLSSILVPDEAPEGFVATAGTKVVCTIGPSCCEVDTLRALLRAGMTVARIDLTWGPLPFHEKSLENLQTALKLERRMCAIMIDTLGREIMVRRQFRLENGWPMHDSSLKIAAGSTVTLTTRPDAVASDTLLPITYSKFSEMVSKGDTVYIGRYLVSGADRASLYLEVVEVTGTEVTCTANNDAELDGLCTVFHSERSGDNLDNLQNDLPFLSDYDKDSLARIAQRFEIDFLSTSYTRSPDDLQEARRFLASIGAGDARVVAKLESRQSLFNFQGILAEADGVIISRGNLGLDIAPEKMAHVQKTLISACNVLGKPVIITRVVDTMVNTPRPTRAEATDIANAVLDGVDGFLLGAETLRGRYPVDTVSTIIKICHSAEAVFDHSRHHDHLGEIAEVAQEALNDWIEGESDDGMDIGGGSISPPEGPSRVASAANGQQMGVHFAEAEAGVGGISPRGAVGNGLGHQGRVNHYGSSNSLSSIGTAGGAWVRGMTAAGASYSSLSGAMKGLSRGMKSSKGSLPQLARSQAVALTHAGDPYLIKLESIASSAVRAAERVGASLIVVYTSTGRTAQLVAKYRPPMPIMTLVVPHLVSDGLRWNLKGKAAARQCLMVRGLLPVLAAPSPSGDALLEEAVAMSGRLGLVNPHEFVVCVQRINQDFCVKVVAVDEFCQGIRKESVVGGAALGQQASALMDPHSPILGASSTGPFSPRTRAPTDDHIQFIPTLSTKA